MSSSSFDWCARCGFILAVEELPPVGANVHVVLVYTNAINPGFPVSVVRIGTSLRRHNDLVFVSADGGVVPASAVVAWRPSTSTIRPGWTFATRRVQRQREVA